MIHQLFQAKLSPTISSTFPRQLPNSTTYPHFKASAYASVTTIRHIGKRSLVGLINTPFSWKMETAIKDSKNVTVRCNFQAKLKMRKKHLWLQTTLGYLQCYPKPANFQMEAQGNAVGSTTSL